MRKIALDETIFDEKFLAGRRSSTTLGQCSHVFADDAQHHLEIEKKIVFKLNNESQVKEVQTRILKDN